MEEDPPEGEPGGAPGEKGVGGEPGGRRQMMPQPPVGKKKGALGSGREEKKGAHHTEVQKEGPS